MSRNLKKAAQNNKSIHDYFNTKSYSPASIESFNKRISENQKKEYDIAKKHHKEREDRIHRQQDSKEKWLAIHRQGYNRGTKREGSQEPGPSNKSMTIDSPNSPMEGQTAGPNDMQMDTSVMASDVGGPQTASGQSGMTGGGGGMRGAAELPHGIFQEPTIHTRKYSKQYYLKLQWEQLTYTKSETGDAYIKYPITEFPWEHLGFYLTDEEIHELLQQYTRIKVKNVKVKVSNETAILNFDVGSSIATVGNNNVGFKAAEMKNMRGSRMGRYEKVQGDIINNIFWGTHASALPDATDSASNIAALGASFVSRNIDNKFLHAFQNLLNQPFRATSNETSNMYNPSAFNWKAFMNSHRNVSMNEGDWFTQEYSPKNGYIAGYNTIGPMNQNQVLAPQELQNNVFMEGANSLVNEYSLFPLSTNNSPNVYSPLNPSGVATLGPNADNKNTANQIRNMGYIAPGTTVAEGTTQNIIPDMPFIDNSQYKHILIETIEKTSADIHSFKTPMQPTLAIGLLPLVSNNAENSTINGWMQIVLDVHCEIELHTGQCAPFYPHRGSGSYHRQFPMPYAFKPMVQLGSFNVLPAAAPAVRDTIRMRRFLAPDNLQYERAYRYGHQRELVNIDIQDQMLADNTAGQLPVPPVTMSSVETRAMVKRKADEKQKLLDKKSKTIIHEEISDDDNILSDASDYDSIKLKPNKVTQRTIIDMIKKNSVK